MQRHHRVQVLPLSCSCLFVSQLTQTFYQIGEVNEKTRPTFGKSCDLILSCLFQSKTSRRELNIVTTFYPVYEFTKQVAGDTANVELLIGAGTEPQ